MKKLLPILLLLLPACAWLEDVSPLGRSRAEVGQDPYHGRGGPGDSASTDVRRDTTVYLAGVEFPEDYNWQRDSAYGNVSCKLLLCRGSECILSLPAGPGTLLSADPDMHRLVGGHLYTDYSTLSETIVSRDGKELFRYAGREMIRGFLLRRDTLYTLGQNRSGPGLSLRADGKLLFSSEAGTVLGGMYDALCPTGALYEDNGRLCFVYYASRTGGGTGRGARRWYGVTDGLATELDPPVDEVLDIRYRGGEPVYAGASGNFPLVLRTSVSQQVISSDPGDKVHYCRLLSSGDGLFLKTDITPRLTGMRTRSLYREDGSRMVQGGARKLLDFYLDGVAGYISAGEDGRIEQLYDGSRRFSPEGDYRMIGGRCAVLFGGELYAALSPLEASGSPALLRSGTETILPFRGCLSAIEVIVK